MSSGAYPPRISRHPTGDPSGEIGIDGIRIQYLETRVHAIESALNRQTEEAGQLRVELGSLKTEVRGMHDDLGRLNSGIVETKTEIKTTIAQAAGLLKWLTGIIVTVGLGLGITMIQMCHANDTAITKTTAEIEHLRERDRDFGKDVETFRHLLAPRLQSAPVSTPPRQP